MTKDVSACNSIIFDFSGVIGPKIKTLESWRGMERRMLGLVWDELNPPPEVRREKVHEMKSRHRTDALHAAIKKELDERGSKLDLYSILKVFYHAERQALERDFSKWNMHADAIRALRKSGFSMAVMSNSMQCYVEHFLAASGISGNFKHVITPESIGWESKPGKAAYEHALRITGFSPTSTIFIDNKPEKEFGKKRYGDLYEGKLTLIMLHAYNAANRAERARIDRIYKKERNSKTKAEIDFLAYVIEKYGSVEYARAEASRYGRMAQETLRDNQTLFPENEYKEVFTSAVESLFIRKV